MFKLCARETVLNNGKLYDVDVEIAVTETYPWSMSTAINGKRFDFPMTNFPANVEEATVVFELLANAAERREYCEFVVNNLFVVLPGGKRVRAVDYYCL